MLNEKYMPTSEPKGLHIFSRPHLSGLQSSAMTAVGSHVQIISLAQASHLLMESFCAESAAPRFLCPWPPTSFVEISKSLNRKKSPTISGVEHRQLLLSRS